MSGLLRLALRSHRGAIITMTIVSALGGASNAFGFVQIAGKTHAERLAFAHSMELIGAQFSYFLPPPVQLDTMGGYLTWRNFSSMSLVFAVWAILAATGLARGDEERNLTELWLATGVSRLRWLAVRTAGFALAATIAIAAMVALVGAAAAAAGDPLPIGGLVLEGLASLALTLCAFGFGVFVAQFFVTRRAAGLAGSGVLLALFFLNSARRSGVDIGALRWLSPFSYFDRSTPLLDGGQLDWSAIVVQLAAAAALITLAALAFVRRDVGGTLITRRGRSSAPSVRPSRDPLLRMPVLAAVEQQRGWIIGWAIGLSILGYFLVSITRTLVDAMLGIPALAPYFAVLGVAGPADFVGIIWFATALLLIAIFVVVQANGWAADDAEGRLALWLSQPVSRTRIVIERLGSLLVACGVVVAASTFAVYLSARASGLPMPAGRTALAGFLMLPVAFALGGVGEALVGWRPRLAIVLLGIVTGLSYFIQQFAPIFRWPDWTLRLSIFALYGQPLSRDDWGGIAILLAMGAAGAAIAVVTMRRRDIGS